MWKSKTEGGKKKKKDDILTIVADLHCPSVVGAAQKTAPEEPRASGKSAIRNMLLAGQEEFHKLRLKHSASPGRTSQRSAGDVLLYRCTNKKRSITTHLVPKSVYGGDVIVVDLSVCGGETV